MTTGAQLYDRFSQADGNPYHLSAEVDNVPWSVIVDPHIPPKKRRPLDCSEGTQKVTMVENVRPPLPDGARNQRDYCQRAGTLIPVQRAIHIRGALGFIIRPSGVCHVVMFAGDGKTTMEAANHIAGCGHFSVTTRGKLRFNFAALIPGVYYPEMAPHLPSTSPNPSVDLELVRQVEHAVTTIVGFAPNEIHAGPEVTTLQILLNGKLRGRLNPPLELTGVLDPRTQLVLIGFKRDHHLSNPGVAAAAGDTWKALTA